VAVAGRFHLEPEPEHEPEPELPCCFRSENCDSYNSTNASGHWWSTSGVARFIDCCAAGIAAAGYCDGNYSIGGTCDPCKIYATTSWNDGNDGIVYSCEKDWIKHVCNTLHPGWADGICDSSC
jgi:hypothetical protein